MAGKLLRRLDYSVPFLVGDELSNLSNRRDSALTVLPLLPIQQV